MTNCVSASERSSSVRTALSSSVRLLLIHLCNEINCLCLYLRSRVRRSATALKTPVVTDVLILFGRSGLQPYKWFNRREQKLHTSFSDSQSQRSGPPQKYCKTRLTGRSPTASPVRSSGDIHMPKRSTRPIVHYYNLDIHLCLPEVIYCSKLVLEISQSV